LPLLAVSAIFAPYSSSSVGTPFRHTWMVCILQAQHKIYQNQGLNQKKTLTETLFYVTVHVDRCLFANLVFCIETVNLWCSKSQYLYAEFFQALAIHYITVIATINYFNKLNLVW